MEPPGAPKGGAAPANLFGFPSGAQTGKENAAGNPQAAPKGGLPKAFSVGADKAQPAPFKGFAPAESASGEHGVKSALAASSPPKAAPKIVQFNLGGLPTAPTAPTKAVVSRSAVELPEAPDIVGRDDPQRSSNRELLRGLTTKQGADLKSLLCKPGFKSRLEMLTSMYSGPPVVTQDQDVATPTPRTADMRKKGLLCAHILSAEEGRKTEQPNSDGRDDSWIDQVSFMTNLHQKQAFQLWQLFRETILEDDHFATQAFGSRDFQLTRAVLPSTVEELGVIKEPKVAQGSRQTAHDILEFYFSERLDIIRCAIVALTPGEARRDALRAAGLSPRKMLHAALFTLAETAGDRTGLRGGVGARWPHVEERHLAKPVERGLRIPLCAHDRSRVDPQLREREPRQQEEEHLLLLQLILQALTADASDAVDRHPHQDLDMLLETFEHSRWHALPPQRQVFGVMLRCLVVMQWFCVDSSAGMQARLRGSGVGSRGVAQKIDESVDRFAKRFAKRLDAERDFCHDAVPAMVSLSWALCALQQVVKAKRLIESFTVEFDTREHDERGFGRTNFATLDDQTKRQRRELTQEESKLREAAIDAGVTEDKLHEHDLLSYDDGGEWPCPNPKRKIKMELDGLHEDFASYFDKSNRQASALGAHDVLHELVELAGECEDEALAVGFFKDTLWRSLLGWTDPDIVRMDRQSNFLKLIPRIIQNSQSPVGQSRGPMELRHINCSCERVGKQLQVALGDFLEEIKHGSVDQSNRDSSPAASRFRHIVCYTLENFAQGSEKFAALMAGMALGSDQTPTVLQDLLNTVDVPVAGPASVAGIAVGRQRTCVLTPRGGATAPLRVLVVHTVMYCCERLRSVDPKTTEHANTVTTLRAWLQLLVALLGHNGRAENDLTDDWLQFVTEVAATHYWERYHLDLLAHLVPTGSGEPPYLISTARAGAGVGVALCASILRALPSIRSATSWDVDGLETATACVEVLTIAAANGSGHLAFYSPNDSHGARFVFSIMQSIDIYCAKAATVKKPSVAWRLQKQRGKFAVACLDFMSLLLSHLQCRTAAWNLVAEPEDCVRLISHFAAQLASGLSHNVLDHGRWLVAERCAAVLAQCLDTAGVLTTISAGSSGIADSQARLTVLRTILVPHAEDSAILDFLLEHIAQSLRWRHLLARQARPKALITMHRVIARSLDLIRAALSTPVDFLRRHDLHPMSGTTLARRLFLMRTTVTGPTNDQNTSLVDEIAELCSWKCDGFETGRDVVLAATRTMTVLCRLLGSPDFGCGETPTSAANHQKAKLNGGRPVVGDTALRGSAIRDTRQANRPVSWSIVAALGGPRACQAFVLMAEKRLSEFSVQPESEELYLAMLDLVDAAISSRDGLADFYVSPSCMTLVWDKQNQSLDKNDVKAVVAKLLHCPISKDGDPDLRVLQDDRGCKVLDSARANEVELDFATPNHFAHAERIFGLLRQRKGSIEFKRGSRVVKFSGEGLLVVRKPAGFLQELLQQLSKTRGDACQRYASGLELLYNILQHYCDYPPVVVDVLLRRDLMRNILPESKAAGSKVVRNAVSVHAMAVGWRVAGQCLGIAASCMKDEKTAANAKCLREDIEQFVDDNLQHSISDMFAIDSSPQRSLQDRLQPFGIVADSFSSVRAMVSSVVLNPRFDTRQVLGHMSFAARSRFSNAQRELTELELLNELWQLRKDMLDLSADVLCYGYGEPPLDGTQAQAEGLVWAGDDEYEQYFFQLSGPILTHYEFRDEGDVRTMRGDTKTHFHIGGSKIVRETVFSVGAGHSYRIELELAAGGEITLELHPRQSDPSGWEAAKDLMRLAVQDAIEYPCLYMKELAGSTATMEAIVSAAGATYAAVAKERDLAVKMCTELEGITAPLLRPCARKTFYIQTVALQGHGAPTQMGSVSVQASTAPQLVANVLAQLCQRVYLNNSCPGTDEEIRTQFRKYGRVRRADLCESNGIRWVQYDNFDSAERARSANERHVDTQRIKAARCMPQGASAFMRRKGSGEFSLFAQLDADVDDEHLLLRHEPDSRTDYARFLGLRSGKLFFARLTPQEHETASELLRAMVAICIALTIKSDEAHRQLGVFQTRLATAVSSMVGVYVHIPEVKPIGVDVRAKLMRTLQRGMLAITRRAPKGQGYVSRLEASALLLAFLLKCRSNGRKREGPLGELTVYIREEDSLQSESLETRLGRMFDTIDTDASGEVDTDEGKAFLIAQGVPSEQAEQLWRKLLAQADSNADGKLDKQEWIDGFFKVQAGIQGQTLASALDEILFQTTSVRHRFDNLFDQIDVDKSGTIDALEAKAFFSQEGFPPAFLDQFWQELLEKADFDSDGQISREEWSSKGAEVFISAKRAGRVSFANSIVNMTMQLKHCTTARHLLAKIDHGKIQGKIEDVYQVDTSMYRECTYGLADENAPGRIFRQVLPTAGTSRKMCIIVHDPDKVSGLLAGMLLESINGEPVERIGTYDDVIARIKSAPKPVRLSMHVPERATARIAISNRVVDLSLPTWRFSDSAKLRMSRLFDAIDTDGSGELDLHEWKAFLTEQRVDPAKHEQNWNTLMKEVDTDGNGQVEKDEFTEGWLRLFGWKAAARDVEGVFRATAIPDRPDELVMLKTAKLTQLNMAGTHVGGSSTDEDAAVKQSTLAQALIMCKSLFEASGVTPGGLQHWALARAALVNLLTISNELAKMFMRDRDGTHSRVCGRGTGRDGPVANENDAREKLIEQLLIKEWGERLGSDPYEAALLISGTLPSICASLKHLHVVAEDMAHSPLNDQRLREQMEHAFRSRRNISVDIPSSHPMSAAEQRPPRKFTICPCVRGGLAQDERGVLLLGDGQAAFVPESGSATTIVLLHNVTVKTSGERGLTLTLDRRGVAAGVVLEVGDLLHHHETLRTAVALHDEAVARHEVWELALTTLAALVRQAVDKSAVVASLMRVDLVRLLCARLAVLQRPEVVVHGDNSNGEKPDAWGALPSAQLGAATVRRSEADTRLALQIMDALITIAEVSTGEHQVVQLMVASEAISVLTEFVFDDEELAAVYERDGRRSSSHILWCRILRFVSTLMRIILTQMPYRGNNTLVAQLMAFISSHQNRLGLQWSGSEVVRSIAPALASALPKAIWHSGSNTGQTCPALGLAKLGGTRTLNTARALLALRSRGLTKAWLEEIEAVSRLLTVVGNSAAVWKSTHPKIMPALVQRLMDTVRVCTLVLQTAPVRDVAKSSAGSGTLRKEGGTIGRVQSAADGGIFQTGSRHSSAGSDGSRGSSKLSRNASKRPSRLRSRPERQGSKVSDFKSQPAAELSAEENAASSGVHTTDLFTGHYGQDQRLCTPQVWHTASGVESGASGARTPAEQKALAIAVNQSFLSVIKSATHCLRALSPAPLPGRVAGASGIFSLPCSARPELPPIRDLQQQIERFAERRCVVLLREQARPMACYHQGSDDSLYRAVAFQLNAELAEDDSGADGDTEYEHGSVPWWLADNDPEEVIEKVGMVLGLLQIFDKADVDGSGRLDEGECKDLLETMFDDDRRDVIDNAWNRLLKRVEDSNSRGRSARAPVISKDEWVHVWMPPADPSKDWVPLRPYVLPDGSIAGATSSGRAAELQSIFRLKGVDVYQELFDELAKAAHVRSIRSGKSVDAMDSAHIDKLPRALDLDRVLSKEDVEQVRADLKLVGGEQLTLAAWRAWLQSDKESVKNIIRLKNERLADDELFDVVDQMRNDHGRFGISVCPPAAFTYQIRKFHMKTQLVCCNAQKELAFNDVSYNVRDDANILLAIAYAYNRPVHVFQYSSRPIFNSDEHVPQSQVDWCQRADQAALSNGTVRGADWTTMKLNDRGKARHPIKLSIHLFGRPRYAAVLQAKVAAPAATGLDGPRDVRATAQDDPRVVRLLEVEGEPAQTTVQRRHWLDSWWQVEDSALWCLIGHVGQLVTSASAGETAARQAAGAARHKRLAAEARLFAEQAHLQAGLDLDVEALERGLEVAQQAELSAARAAVALAPWMIEHRAVLDDLAALLRALPPSRAARKETRRMEQQAGLGGVALGANGQWVGADGSDPLDRMLSALMPAVQQLAHIASKACETATVPARRREQGAQLAVHGGENQSRIGQITAAAYGNDEGRF